MQTLKQTEAERVAELESFSCRPADVPHPHVLMAFYGSLESLWLLLTQWDSLLGQRGLQGTATIHCRSKILISTKGDVVLPLESLTTGFVDSILNTLNHLFGSSATLDYIFASF